MRGAWQDPFVDSVAVVESLVAVLPLAMVPLALRPVSDREIVRFCGRYSLPRQTRIAALPRAIACSRGLRLLGAAVGFSLPVVARALTHDWLNVGGRFLWGVAGYLVGALVAAILPVARPGDAARSAALVPRRVRDYIGPVNRALPGFTLALCLVGAAAFLLAPRRPSADASAMIGTVVLGALASLVTIVAAQWVVRRPQSVADQDLVAVDDAMRAHGMHLIYGTGNAVAALAASGASFLLGDGSDVQLLRWVSPWLGAVGLGLAMSMWWMRTDGWKVPPKVPV